MQPQLSLEYNSQSERGLAGIGWTLRGVSTITRCPRTQRQDGIRGAVTLTGADRFCMDGQRLVLAASGTYGAAGAVYRTEQETFSRVTSNGTAGNGPAWFKVETKSGLTMEYGNTVDSRVRPGPAAPNTVQPETALLWAINKVTDRAGNAITFTYTTDPTIGSYVLQRIDYNAGKAWVEFDYDIAPSRVSYVAGTKTTSKHLLSKVRGKVLVAGQPLLVKEYRLSYSSDDIKGTLDPDSRLVGLTECGADGNCLPPLAVDWNYWGTSHASFLPSTSTGMSTAFTATTGWTEEWVTPRRFVDVNADGLPDIVGFAYDGVYVLLNTPNGWPQGPVKKVTGFGNNQGFNDENLYPRRLVDMNRDGHPDIVGFRDGVWISFWNQASQTFTTPVLVSSEFNISSDWYVRGQGIGDSSCPRQLVDMNGDGYPDIVGFCRDGVYLAYWNPATTSFSAKSLNLAQFGAAASWTRESARPRHLVDLNGDGYADIIGFGQSAVYVSFWNPSAAAFDAMQVVLTSRFTSDTGWSDENLNPRQLVDMNGDGNLDIVGFASDGVWVALWNGKRFEEPTRWTTGFSATPWGNENANPRQLADVNGDGFADIIGFGSDGTYVALSNGRNAFTTPTRWTAELGSATTDVFGTLWNNESKYPRRIEDSDGNGMPDIMAFGKDRVTFIQPSAPPGIRVTGITTSLGHRTDIQYTLAQAFSGFYTKDQVTSTHPFAEQTVPMFVVSRVKQGDGLGGSQTARYRYGGLKTHHDHGSLGFRWRAVRDETTGIETYTEVSQTYPYVGMPVVSETYRSTLSGSPCFVSGAALCLESFSVSKGAPLQRTTSTPAHEVLGAAGEYASNSRVMTYVSQTVESSWELSGDPLPTKTTVNEMKEPTLVPGSKQWGNVTKVRVAFSDGHATETNNTYFAADEANWVLGRLQRATVADTRPARTINVAAVTDAAPSSSTTPINPAVLNAILSILLDD